MDVTKLPEDIFSDKQLIAEIKQHSRPKTVPRDAVLISSGDDIVFIPIVLKGALRVMRQNKDGLEVFLYHLYPGQSCAMLLNCCQGRRTSNIKAIAEEDTDILLIPSPMVEDWFRYPEWKAYISYSNTSRFAELMEVIDLIAFSNMDKQVLHYLQERAKASGTTALFVTHQQIADELHTHREAISRLLRSMEEKNILKLGRNSIEIL